MENFADRLHKAVREKNSRVCVGLDPRPEKLPDEFRGEGAEGVGEFCRRVVDAVRGHAVAVKPQIAFFEQLGSPGVLAYEKTVRHARDRGLLVIGDVKRSDIATSAHAYAVGQFRAFGCDAITVNPFFGTDGIEPFVKVAGENGGGLFILVKTSNPSSAEFQDLQVDGRPIYRILADRVTQWGGPLKGKCGYSAVGAVVGATHPEVAAELRAAMPDAFFLVPGYGAQGATAADAARCFRPDDSGAIVNASRSVIFAFEPGAKEWEPAVTAAAEKMKHEINDALKTR